MKLSPTVDLAPIRAAALERVDRAFLPRVAPHPLAAAWSAKAARARAVLDGGTDDAIATEARERGLAPADLARAILAKADESAAALMAAETARQAAKARVRAAPHQHAILAILAEVECP